MFGCVSGSGNGVGWVWAEWGRVVGVGWGWGGTGRLTARMRRLT